MCEDKKKINWISGDKKSVRWSLNFEDLNFTTNHDSIQSERFVHMIIDPIETLGSTDSSLALYEEYRKQGRVIFLHEPKDIALRGRTLILSGVPVADNDVVWCRLDPLNTVHYYEKLRLLASTDVKMINSPKNILLNHDKLTSLLFSDDNRLNDTMCFSNWNDLQWRVAPLLKKHRKLVIKAPSNSGGSGVKFIRTMEELKGAYDSLIEESGYVLIVPFYRDGITDGVPVDRRIVLTNSGFLCGFDRIGKDEDSLCNNHSGATSAYLDETFITPTQNETCLKIIDFMLAEDIFIVGVDFLGDFVSEVNISCVGFSSTIPSEMSPRCLKLIEQADEYFPH